MSLIAETNEAYNSRAGVRATILKEILRSPAHAKALINSQREPTPAMELGLAVHAAILEPDVFEKYIVSPKFDKRTKDGKAAALDFEASNAGRTPIDEDKYRLLEGCVKSVYSNSVAKEMLSNGQSEMTVAWRESNFNGLECKARPDFYREGLCVDVKTCQDASLDGFSRQVATLKYHVQAFHYLRGLTCLTGAVHETFRIVAVETKAPYAIAVYELDFGTLERAAFLWERAMGLYYQCMTLNEWPGYPVEVQSLSLPPWAFGHEGED